jgi:hypothetical protein
MPLGGWQILLRLFARIVVLVVLTGGITFLLLRPDEDSSTCTQKLKGAGKSLEVTPTKVPANSGDTSEQSATLTLAPNQEAQIRIGRSIEARTLALSLNPSGPVQSQFDVRSHDFLRDDGSRLGPEAVSGKAFVSGKGVTLVACADRRMFHAHPGTYIGGLTVVSTAPATAHIELLTVPVTIKFAYDGIVGLGASYFSVVLLAGTFYAWALKRALVADAPVLSTQWLSDYLRWWKTLGGVLSMSFGSAAAAGVFNAQYVQ